MYRQRVDAKLYGYHEPTGENRVVRVYDGHLNVANYLDSIGLGKIADHNSFGGFGQRTSCSTTVTGDDCWEGASTTCPIPDQTTGEQLTILCASASDAAAIPLFETQVKEPQRIIYPTIRKIEIEDASKRQREDDSLLLLLM